jgi:hypothetical protein
MSLQHRKTLRSLGRWALALGPFAAALWLIGCPGSLEDPGRFLADGGEGGSGGAACVGHTGGPGCVNVECDLFVNTCGAAGCHSGPTPATKLNLVLPGVDKRLVNQPSVECTPGLLVDTADPTASIMYQKLTTSPPCGSQMPLTGAKMTTSELQCFVGWIEALRSEAGQAGGGGTGAGGSGGSG